MENIKLKLKCYQCGCHYEKPTMYKKYYEHSLNVFFKWSLEFCDPCRRQKQAKAFKNLPDVLRALGEV